MSTEHEPDLDARLEAARITLEYMRAELLKGCRPLLAAVDAQRGTISARTREELERGAARWESRNAAAARR